MITGTTDVDMPGSYGTIGVPSEVHYPGARKSALCWLNPNDPTRLHLYSGHGFGNRSMIGKLDLKINLRSDLWSTAYLEDQWSYDLQGGTWTWVGGAPTGIVIGKRQQTGSYPTGRVDATVGFLEQKAVIFGGDTWESRILFLFYSPIQTIHLHSSILK